MKTKFCTIAVALLALVLCGTVMLQAQAQNDNSSTANQAWRGHRHGHMGFMARELNLTDAQKTQVKTLFQAQRAANRPLMQQLAQNRVAMLNLTAGGAFDQAKVQALAAQQSQLMAQMTVQKESLQSQIYNQVLTSEQKAKADQLRQTRIARINERMQRLSQSGNETPAQQ
jgi:Spy/CpxP family protein refolding chaperone